MKLRRRRKEEEGAPPLLAPPSPSQAATRPRSSSRPPPTSFPSSPPPPSPTSPQPTRPSLSAATDRESNALQLSLPSCPAPSFLLHKITEAVECGEKDRGGAPSLPTQLFYLTITGRAQLAAPLLRWPACPPPFSFSLVSRCGSSTSSEAIGKQSMKMNYPVSSPSSLNK